ncbi:MAG TPA: hypothetical protein VFP84_25965 [Kofleriaceae bacterium]|nr:hypothetical protein [Kofleriaceae bacterium]
MRNILLAVVVASGLVGCVGGIDDPTTPPTGSGSDTTPPTGGSGEAKAAFDANVYPILAAKCKVCHTSGAPLGNVTGFVDSDATKGYQTAINYVALVGTWTPDAPILSKIALGHNGQTYTDPEKASITDWLSKELAARATGGDGTPPPATGTGSPVEATDRLLAEWSGCMTLANFQTANMKAWGNLKADNSACKTCHINAEFGNIAMDVDAPFFTFIDTNRYLMAQYFTIDFSKGVDQAKIVVNTNSFKNVGLGLPPHTEHPRFNPTNNAGMTALQKFYDLTMANKAAGTCGPSQLKN